MAGCEKYQESKDIGKFPGNREKIGLDEKKNPENDVSLIRGSMDNLHGGHQTVLAGESQERKGQETSVCMMAPEHDLGLNPPSSQIPNRQTLQQQKLHSWKLSPFAVTPSRLLGGPTEPVEGNEEDLMRPTSASTTTSRENEKRESTDPERASNATSSSGRDMRSRGSVEGDFLSASTDVYSQEAAAETERYSAALLKITADDLEVTVQDTQIKFLHNLSTAVEDSECSEQVRKAVKDSVRDEGHAGDGESGENFRGDFFKDNPIASAATYQSDREALSRYRALECAAQTTAAAALSGVTPTSSIKAPAYRSLDDWESGAAIGFANPVCLDVFLHNRRDQEYAGQGYGLLVSQFLASRQRVDESKARNRAVRLKNGSRRKLRRELRTIGAKAQYLGFEAFKSFAEANSYQLSEDVYSAVDSGTTVSISADGKLLMDGFDPKSAVKIVGFNGSMSKSSGSGDIVGFAYSRDKRRIPLRVQKVHSVLGAPNDLLSVSALLQQGYEFHFTKEKSWIVTPEMVILDLIEKGGLFRLKW